MSISNNYLRGCQDALLVVEKVAGKNVAKGVGKMLGMGGAGAAAGGAAGFGLGHAQRAAAGMNPKGILEALGHKSERQFGFLPEAADKYLPGDNTDNLLTQLKHKAMFGVGKDAVKGTGEGLSDSMGLGRLGNKLGLGGKEGDRMHRAAEGLRDSSHIPDVPESVGGMYGLRDLLNKGIHGVNHVTHGMDDMVADGVEGLHGSTSGLGHLMGGDNGMAGKGAAGLAGLVGEMGPDVYHNLRGGAELGGLAGLGAGAAGLAAKAMKGKKQAPTGLEAIKARLGLG